MPVPRSCEPRYNTRAGRGGSNSDGTAWRDYRPPNRAEHRAEQRLRRMAGQGGCTFAQCLLWIGVIVVILVFLRSMSYNMSVPPGSRDRQPPGFQGQQWREANAREEFQAREAQRGKGGSTPRPRKGGKGKRP